MGWISHQKEEVLLTEGNFMRGNISSKKLQQVPINVAVLSNNSSGLRSNLFNFEKKAYNLNFWILIWPIFQFGNFKLHCSQPTVSLKWYKWLYVWSGTEVLVPQSCPALCNHMDCSPPGFSVPGILQARVLEGVAVLYSRGVFLTQGSNLHLLHCRQILYHLSHEGSRARNDITSQFGYTRRGWHPLPW